MLRSIVRFTSPLLALVLCAPSLVSAHPAGSRAPYLVSVEDPHGGTLPTFHHRGRTYVLGQKGERYNVRIENRTDRRVEAVLSVDGRDAVSGREGDYVAGRGYVLDPWSEVVVEGFRASFDEVAAFRFTDPSNSYSARMGTPENVGVIGVAFFPERIVHTPRPPRIPRPVYRSYDETGRSAPNRRIDDLMDGALKGADVPAASGRGSRSAAEAGAPLEEAELRSRQNLGTEYGESIESHVHEVEFRRASTSRPAELVTLYYDDARGLQARGIRVERPRPIVGYGPEPFPGRFAPPPPR